MTAEVLNEWDTGPDHDPTILNEDQMRSLVESDPRRVVDGAFVLPVAIDWSDFWARDRTAADWLYPDVLARGRGHALYAGHKAGKTLFVQFIVGKLATGKEPIVCAYFDFEQTEDDLYERLADMGYGPDTDLSRLAYYLLPALPPLDEPEGAKVLGQILDDLAERFPGHHQVVIIDTTARAVIGNEDAADTVRAFYRWSGLQLKRRGVTWVRLDHAGKDAGKGQRGSSAKGDDVDVVWRLVPVDNGIELRRDAARMAWVPEKVAFRRHDDPLEYFAIAAAWPEGTKTAAELLDQLNVDLNASGATAVAALKAHGEPRRKAIVLAALRWRRAAATK